MKQKVCSIVTVALFLALIALVPLYWLLFPRKTFSDSERRYLSEPPKLSAADLKNWSFDDAVETFMLNLFFEGRIGCFQPVTYLSRVDLRVIRPLLYTPEKEVRAFAATADLPVVKSSCPADENTQRESMKQLLASLERQHKGLHHRIFHAMQAHEIDGLRLPERRPLVMPEPDIEEE